MNTPEQFRSVMIHYLLHGVRHFKDRKEAEAAVTHEHAERAQRSGLDPIQAAEKQFRSN